MPLNDSTEHDPPTNRQLHLQIDCVNDTPEMSLRQIQSIKLSTVCVQPQSGLITYFFSSQYFNLVIFAFLISISILKARSSSDYLPQISHISCQDSSFRVHVIIVFLKNFTRFTRDEIKVNMLKASLNYYSLLVSTNASRNHYFLSYGSIQV